MAGRNHEETDTVSGDTCLAKNLLCCGIRTSVTDILFSWGKRLKNLPYLNTYIEKSSLFVLLMRKRGKKRKERKKERRKERMNYY